MPNKTVFEQPSKTKPKVGSNAYSNQQAYKKIEKTILWMTPLHSVPDPKQIMQKLLEWKWQHFTQAQKVPATAPNMTQLLHESVSSHCIMHILDNWADWNKTEHLTLREVVQSYQKTGSKHS